MKLKQKDTCYYHYVHNTNKKILSFDLDSTLIVPDDYVPMIVEYIKGQLAFERSRPIDTANDGVDNNN